MGQNLPLYLLWNDLVTLFFGFWLSSWFIWSFFRNLFPSDVIGLKILKDRSPHVRFRGIPATQHGLPALASCTSLGLSFLPSTGGMARWCRNVSDNNSNQLLQTINQYINQPINQSTNEPAHQQNNQTNINKWICLVVLRRRSGFVF